MRTRPEDYTVGWVCAIEIERVVAREMLDEEYARDKEPYIDALRDNNSYTFGRIYNHNVVIAGLPHGRYGITSAAIVATHMQSSFPNLRTRLMVGIAGGAPSKKHDICLGDIIVSSPTSGYSGVIQYDFGKTLQKQDFEITSHMAPPPDHLVTRIAHLKAKHKASGHRIAQVVTSLLEGNPRLRIDCSRPEPELDQLFRSDYNHADQAKCNCQSTDASQHDTSDEPHQLIVSRSNRGESEDNPKIHYGLIASANQLMKDASARDALVERHDVLCFEMEAAGLMNSFPGVIIRGIYDYSDSHKNDAWQGYAAAVAAAYAKELLEVTPAFEIPRIRDEVNQQMNYKFSIPFILAGVPVTKKFVDRPGELQCLQDVLLLNNNRRKIFVLRGLGGIGKTQLAVEFMRLHHAEFSAVLWLDGSSVDSLKKSIVQHASRIPPDQIPTRDSDIDTVVQEVIQWLSLPNNNKWLLIFDNVDREFADLDPLSYDIRTYIPNSDHGSILITTRLAQLEKLGESLAVKKVDYATAQGILTSWYKQKDDETDIKDLLEKLDGLPLAIAQAGAYLQESGMSVKTYLRLYEEQKREVAEALLKSDTLLNDYTNRSVWTTWNISYNAILAKNQYAANLLVFWSFLDRNDLWYDIFQRAGHSTSIASDLSSWLGKVAAHELSFIEAMSMLRSFSLVESTLHTQGYSMHAVVHRWVYFSHGVQQPDLHRLALKVIGFAVPSPLELESGRLHQRLLPHVNICSAKTLNDLAWIEGHSCHPKVRINPQETEDLIAAMNNFGILYVHQGKFSAAEELLIQVLQGEEALFGPDHVATLQAISNLGMVYCEQGRFNEAEKMLLRVLHGFKATKTLPRSILTVTHNLGRIYLEQGKLDEAEKLLKQALQGKKEEFGPKDLTTLVTANLLGNVYYYQGKLDKAEAMLLLTLRGYEQVVGSEHVKTHFPALYNMLSLGDLYSKTRPDEARAMYLQALAGYTTVQGSSSDICVEIRQCLEALSITQEPNNIEPSSNSRSGYTKASEEAQTQEQGKKFWKLKQKIQKQSFSLLLTRRK